jgi:hypothetical protein
MRFKFIILLFVFPFLILCSKKNATNPEVVTVEDLLIKNNEISGWLRTGEGWVVNSEKELYDKIDGYAEAFTKYGFVEGAQQDYQGTILNSPSIVTLQIFDQGTVSNAQNVFNDIATKLSNPENWGSPYLNEAKIERFTLSQNIVCRKSKYYIKLTVDSNLTEALELLKTFANNVGSKIK